MVIFVFCRCQPKVNHIFGVLCSRGCFPILFNHRSFRKPAFFQVSGGFLERRIPGKNGGGTPRFVGSSHLFDHHFGVWGWTLGPWTFSLEPWLEAKVGPGRTGPEERLNLSDRLGFQRGKGKPRLFEGRTAFSETPTSASLYLFGGGGFPCNFPFARTRGSNFQTTPIQPTNYGVPGNIAPVLPQLSKPRLFEQCHLRR